MIAVLRRFPLLVILSLIASTGMVFPALHAVWLEDLHLAGIFAFHGLVWTGLAIMIGIASSAQKRTIDPPRQVVLLLIAYFALPVILAAPLNAAVPAITFQQAYFEMLSCLTTTGATIFDIPGNLADPLHLWRGLTSWAGGLLILVAAVSVLGPLQMGGFEIEQAATRVSQEQHRGLGAGREEVNKRLVRSAIHILPPYALLTAALALALMILGDRALVALIHAMSVVSTSGITPLGEFGTSPSGHLGEVMIFAFLMVALTRGANLPRRWDRLRFRLDPEKRLALACILGLTTLLFLRHFLGAIQVQGQDNLAAAGKALWGSLFSILSFLSTTGFESRDWGAMQNWSGLETPGLILLALCMMGGGIATTTGGVKLLRIYALYKHGVREMERLIHPNSVGGAGITARRIRRRGARIAWVFLMLFLMGLSAVLLVLTALGQNFEDALVLAIAGLTTTGPAAVLLDSDFSYATLTAWEQMTLSVAMIFGRLELLVLISVLNPSYWRN